MTCDALYIAARAPRPCFTKSRLGRVIGHREAATLYAAFLRDLALRFASAGCVAGWYVTPADAWSELLPLVAPDGQHGPVIEQPDGDWTERQRSLFAEARLRGEQRTVLIASDSPQVSVGLVTWAFRQLSSCDVVLGPTLDGGYYLIGMRSGARQPWNLLADIQMSTGTVLSDLLTRARSIGLTVGLLPPTFDIDEADDLGQLASLAATRTDLSTTYLAMRRLGLIKDAPGAAGSPASAPSRLVPAGGPS